MRRVACALSVCIFLVEFYLLLNIVEPMRIIALGYALDIEKSFKWSPTIFRCTQYLLAHVLQ